MAGGLMFDDEGRVIGGWGNGQNIETHPAAAGGSAGLSPSGGAAGGPSRSVWGPNLPALRALRLWHWREAMKARKSEQNATRRSMHTHANRDYYERQAAAAEKRVGLHIRFVQTLNDYFPPGDTAEADERRSAL